MRVIRSFKEKRSNYAPEEGLRYDGVYLIQACWLSRPREDGLAVCRYYFVRADNEAAPWVADGKGGHRECFGAGYGFKKNGTSYVFLTGHAFNVCVRYILCCHWHP